MIKIYFCDNLKTIHENAFTETTFRTKDILISDNRQLSGNSLFASINKFKSVEEIEIRYNNFSEIPDEAFNKPQSKLWKLEIKGESIKTLGTRAFIGLDNLRELEISETDIDFIPEFAFEFRESSKYPIYIDLKSNFKKAGFRSECSSKYSPPNLVGFQSGWTLLKWNSF